MFLNIHISQGKKHFVKITYKKRFFPFLFKNEKKTRFFFLSCVSLRSLASSLPFPFLSFFISPLYPPFLPFRSLSLSPLVIYSCTRSLSDYTVHIHPYVFVL